MTLNIWLTFDYLILDRIICSVFLLSDPDMFAARINRLRSTKICTPFVNKFEKRFNSGESNKQTAYYVGGIVALVFGLSYASVPLYKVFCQVSLHDKSSACSFLIKCPHLDFETVFRLPGLEVLEYKRQQKIKLLL